MIFANYNCKACYTQSNEEIERQRYVKHVYKKTTLIKSSKNNFKEERVRENQIKIVV